MVQGGNGNHGGSTDGGPTPTAAPSNRVLGLLLVVVVVVLVAAVVGAVVVGDRHSKSPGSLVAAAPNATTSQGSAHFTSTVTLSGITNFQFSLSGTTDFASKSTELQFSGGNVTESIHYVGGVEYFQTPLIHLPGGAHWIRIVPQDLGVSTPTSVATDDPTQGLQFLGGLVGAPVAAGKESVDGVTTTHYQVTLNLQRVFQRIGTAESALSPSFARGYQALAGQIDLSRIPGDVWLDSAGRVRRFAFRLTFEVGGHAASELDSTDYGDFGAAVHVGVPAAADTVAFSAVKGQFSALLNGLG